MKHQIFRTLFLALLCIGAVSVKAQNYYNLTITNNNAGCGVTVEMWGGTPNTLLSSTYAAPSATTSITCQAGRPLNIVFNNGSSCTFQVAPNTTGAFCPAINCSPSCCMTGLSFTTTQTGPVGPPPGSCGMLGFLYTQTVTIN
jgi:hypothetical protein